ncbi:hypothetical protein AGATL06_25710 [Agathobaculum sp. TL06]|mgnify:CR=1 FL=1
MRAVIVAIQGRRAAALASDGAVYRVDAAGRSVGQVIEVASRRRRSWKKPLSWAACAAVLCAMATTGVYAAYEPYAYVSIDAADSIEYTLNRFDQVLEVRAVGEDAAPLTETLQEQIPRFSHLDLAMERTMDQMYAAGGLTGADSDFVMVAVSAKTQEKTARLKEHMGTRLSADRPDGKEPPPAEVIPVSEERCALARRLDTTPGRLELVGRLYAGQEAPSRKEAEYWLDKPAGEIVRAPLEQEAPESNEK